MPPSLHISLPEGLKEYVSERVAEEHYGTASEYVRALIREDQKKRHGERRLEQHMLEGLSSGPAEEVAPESWDTIEAEVAHGLAEPKPQSP